MTRYGALDSHLDRPHSPGSPEHFLSPLLLLLAGTQTLFQSTRAGVPFVEVLKKEGIVPGIKVDTGLENIPGTDGETATMGLDGLSDRCQKYYAQGARFAK